MGRTGVYPRFVTGLRKPVAVAFTQLIAKRPNHFTTMNRQGQTLGPTQAVLFGDAAKTSSLYFVASVRDGNRSCSCTSLGKF
jgi:hypothetical protein